MKYTKSILLLTLTLTLTSCYHAQIVTDREPSSQVIDQPWASSFILGLVPPNIVKTASECPNGLAKVDTELSFLNGLVRTITWGIYTPMHIKVTCAAGTAAVEKEPNEKITIRKSLSDKEQNDAFEAATERSFDTGKTVYVAFN